MANIFTPVTIITLVPSINAHFKKTETHWICFRVPEDYEFVQMILLYSLVVLVKIICSPGVIFQLSGRQSLVSKCLPS